MGRGGAVKLNQEDSLVIYNLLEKKVKEGGRIASTRLSKRE